MLLSISDLAKAAGMERKTVGRRLEGLPWTKGPRGARVYDSKLALAAMLEPQSSDQTNLAQERARLAAHQADKEAIRVAELREQLVHRVDVVDEWRGVQSRISARLQQIAPAVAPAAVEATTVQECQRVIHDAIRDALTDLAADA